jgi:hypothetical protein
MTNKKSNIHEKESRKSVKCYIRISGTVMIKHIDLYHRDARNILQNTHSEIVQPYWCRHRHWNMGLCYSHQNLKYSNKLVYLWSLPSEFIHDSIIRDSVHITFFAELPIYIRRTIAVKGAIGIWTHTICSTNVPCAFVDICSNKEYFLYKVYIPICMY